MAKSTDSKKKAKNQKKAKRMVSKAVEYTPEERGLIAEFEGVSKSKLKPLKYKTVKIEGDNVEMTLDIDPQKSELIYPTLARTFGTHQIDFALNILDKTRDAILVNNRPEGEVVEKLLNLVSATMMELAPRDGFEGMLISQMIAVYHHAMDCFRMATIKDNRRKMDIYSSLQNQGIKLMRTYVAQMEALKKYRTGGQQKMIVEHVHVNEGGQAVIGNMTKGGGDEGKK